MAIAVSGSSRTLSRTRSVMTEASSDTAVLAPCPSAITLSERRLRSSRNAATCADRSSAATSALTRAAVDSTEAVFNSAMVCSCLVECRFNEMKTGKVPQPGIFCRSRHLEKRACIRMHKGCSNAFESAHLAFRKSIPNFRAGAVARACARPASFSCDKPSFPRSFVLWNDECLPFWANDNARFAFPCSIF